MASQETPSRPRALVTRRVSELLVQPCPLWACSAGCGGSGQAHRGIKGLGYRQRWEGWCGAGSLQQVEGPGEDGPYLVALQAPGEFGLRVATCGADELDLVPFCPAALGLVLQFLSP